MREAYLLDTNILSETRKLRANAGVMAFLEAADSSRVFVSVLTLGELRKGVEAKRRSDPVAADRLGTWIDDLETTFTDRVLEVDVPIAKRWGELSAGRSLPVIDTLIAATALIHGLVLATRNIRDVAPTGVRVIDPWRDL